MPILRVIMLVLAGGGFILPVAAYSQQTSSPGQESGQRSDGNVTTGVVVSATSRTMVVRRDDGQHVLFVFERDTERPRAIPTARQSE